MVGIVWIPATTTSFLCLRRFVWWESPGVRCRGFFVCGYGRGVLLLGLFHAFDDVLVLYYPPCPNGFIRVMRVCTHWELHTGVFGLDWSDPKNEDEAKAEYGLANEVIESEWFK